VREPAGAIVQRTTAVEVVFAALHTMIEQGTLKPGELLPSQDKLAEEYGVSRNTVREAVNKLAALGFVTVRQGFGTVVNAVRQGDYVDTLLGHLMMEPVTVAEYVEARLILERASVRLAAEQGDAGALADAARHLERQRVAVNCDDRAAFVEHDAAFHVALAQAAGNSVLARFVLITRELLERFVSAGAETPGAIARDWERHSAILQAVQAQDVDNAVTLMTEHLRESVRAAQDRLGIDFDADALFARGCALRPSF
jgi:GntR family transcriptional regulator, transcriptional repressor for pyruvate dehydrogenase complex